MTATALPLTDLRFSTVELSTGIHVHVAEQGAADGVPVILIHGYSDTWFSHSRLMPLLSRALHVIAFDQRGHGDSSVPPADYSIDTLARDVLALMKARGIVRAVLVGHSMGTLVAQQVAVLAPGQVAAMVLIGGMTSLRRAPGIAELGAEIAALTDPVPLEFTRAFQRGTIHRPIPDAFVERVAEDSQRLPSFAWRALFAAMMDFGPAAALAVRPVPTLLLWGRNDALCTLDEQEALQRLIPGARLVSYAGTGHATHWERPEFVAADIEGFIRNVVR